MDIKYLELIEDINKTHSLTRTAQRLGYTQSGISHNIKKMENDLQIKLFKRTNHGMQATDEARFLLPYIQATTNQYRKFEEALTSIHGLQKGSITIGTYSSMAVHWLPDIIELFKNTYPDIQIHVREGYSDEIIQWIRDETVDFGFMSKSADLEFDFLPFSTEPLLAVVPLDFQWEGPFPVEAFEKYPFIASEIGVDNDISSAFKKENIKPNIQFYCKEDPSIIAMVKKGLGITLLPSLMLKGQKEVKTIPLADTVERTLGIACQSLEDLSAAGKAFVDISKKVVQ